MKLTPLEIVNMMATIARGGEKNKSRSQTRSNIKRHIDDGF
ncbi:hypothetical protein PO124_20625 [Bacillus licheniformis]|nr:hypothetical protein [Bacillus licheniformis]